MDGATLCDLHIHSQFSDGTMTPEAVAAACRQKGIGFAAVCDHDTAAAWPRFAAACRAEGIACIPGTEIHAAFAGGTVHVLGYGFDAAHPGLCALMAENARMMEQLSVELIAAMAADYPQLSPGDYAAFERDPAHGGWKGIDYLGARGFDNTYPGVMQWYGKYRIPPRAFPGTGAVIEAIHAAGGKAVLAHPWQLPGPDDLIGNLDKLVAEGLDGLECCYPEHSPLMADTLTAFCRGRGLLITAGGDGHGDFVAEVRGVRYGIGLAAAPLEKLNLAGLI